MRGGSQAVAQRGHARVCKHGGGRRWMLRVMRILLSCGAWANDENVKNRKRAQVHEDQEGCGGRGCTQMEGLERPR
jgi:hypothetical protein